MSKLVLIDQCIDCPHRYYVDNDLYCDRTKEQVPLVGSIPNNCPLADARNHKIKCTR